MYLLASLQPVLGHRYTGNKLIPHPLLFIVVSILFSPNHPLFLVNVLDSNVYAQIFRTV